MTKDEIKEALKAKGIKSVDLAREARVTPSMVSQVMDGAYPSSHVRKLIIKALGKKPSEIWPPKS